MKEYTGLLALDPGRTTGWAVFGKEAQLMKYGQASMADVVNLDELIDEWDISHVVCEDFKLFRHRAGQQSGSRMEAPQVIGMAKGWAAKRKCEFILQAPSIKPIAEKWSRQTPPSDHSQSHWVDAYNHGFYYLVSLGLRKSVMEEELDERKSSSRKSQEQTEGVDGESRS